MSEVKSSVEVSVETSKVSKKNAGKKNGAASATPQQLQVVVGPKNVDQMFTDIENAPVTRLFFEGWTNQWRKFGITAEVNGKQRVIDLRESQVQLANQTTPAGAVT